MEISEILKYFLPEEIITNFDLVNIKEINSGDGKEMNIFFDEKKNYPPGYGGGSLESKGFLKMTKICDFPIQNKTVKICIRKRRWVDKVKGKIFSKGYDLKHDGTSYSKELASFLKEGVR